MNTETNGLRTLAELKEQHEGAGLEVFQEAHKEPFLVVSTGEGPSFFPLPSRDKEKHILLGQDAGCDIRLEHEGVDECHLEFQYHPMFKEWVFADQGTAKGTVLNDEEVAPFASYILDEKSNIALGEVSIKIWEAIEVAKLVFENEFTQPILPDNKQEEDAPPKPPASGDDLGRVKRFLKKLTREKAQQLTTLVIEARMLGRERFLERYADPILVLRRVVMVRGSDPLYDFDSLPLSMRVYWPMDPKVGKPLWEIGRQPECAIQLQAKVISKVHAEIEYRDDDWWVKDMGSVNGTYVDGRAIPSACAQRLPTKAKLSVSQHISLLFLRSAALYNLLDGFSSDRV